MYNNNSAHTQALRQQTRCIQHYLQNEILFICCHIIHTSAVQLCCPIVYHYMQSCCADFYVWALKYSGSLYLI